jgi:hypothetical protein
VKFLPNPFYGQTAKLDVGSSGNCFLGSLRSREAGVRAVFHTVAPDGSDNAELCQVSSDRFDDRGLLSDEEMPRTMKHQAALLLGRLGRQEPHVRRLFGENPSSAGQFHRARNL